MRSLVWLTGRLIVLVPTSSWTPLSLCKRHGTQFVGIQSTAAANALIFFANFIVKAVGGVKYNVPNGCGNDLFVCVFLKLMPLILFMNFILFFSYFSVVAAAALIAF